MIQEQIYQLKIAALVEANKTGAAPTDILDLAESIYQWLTKEQQEAEAKLRAQKEAAITQLKAVE